MFWHASPTCCPSIRGCTCDLGPRPSELAIFDPQYINGLVQTEDYTRAMYRAGGPRTDNEIERLVSIRMRRQQRLIDGQLPLRLIIDEFALRREFGGPEVMRGQLDRLLELAELRWVSLQVLPSADSPGSSAGFIILDFPGRADPTVVYVEHEAGALYVEKHAQIRPYAAAYDRLRAAAHSPHDPAVLIAHC